MNKIYFTKDLMKWYYENKRDLPWRNTTNFYNVWLSEIMLQQTQVKTVVPYYNKWIKKHKNIKSVSKSTEDGVLKLWENLGYYSRARNFHKACQIIIKKNLDVYNISINAFQDLPGVGEYTAAAVYSIVRNQIVPVIDGNVKRVVSRLLRLDKTPEKYHKKIKTYLVNQIDHNKPGDFNQAIMELGALVCVPKRPKCLICPISKYCLGHKKNDAEHYPIRKNRKIIPNYHIVVGIIWKDNKIIITKRKPNQLLGGLWEFPGGKMKKNEFPEECIKREIKEEININIEINNYLGQIKHRYSHFSIILNAYECNYNSGRIKAIECTDVKLIKLDELNKFAFPKANHKIFSLLKKKYIN